MNFLCKKFLDNKLYKEISDVIKSKLNILQTINGSDRQKAHFISGIFENNERSCVVICENEMCAKDMYYDFKYFLKDNVMYYPAKDILFYSADVKSADIIKKRFETIKRLLNGEKITIVLTAEALFDRLTPKDIFEEYIMNIKEGDNISMEDLAQRLIYMGYERTYNVEGQGQFAIRGGILDLYSATSDYAVRIDFWGDEIDTIKILDSFSQRSVERIESIQIVPVRELVFDEKTLKKAIENIEKEYINVYKVYKNEMPEKAERLKENMESSIEKIKNNIHFSGIDRYIQFFYEKTGSFFDYLDQDAIIFFNEPDKIRNHTENIKKEFEQSIQSKILMGSILPIQSEMIYNYDDILFFASNFSRVILNSLYKTTNDFQITKCYDFESKGCGILKNNIEGFFEVIRDLNKKDYTIIVLAGSRTLCERLTKDINDNGLKGVLLEDDYSGDIEKGFIYVSRGSLKSGFLYEKEKIAIISDKDVLGEDRKQKRKKKKKDKNAIIESYTDLKVGDYIVHENHGIGIFKGVEQLNIDGVSRDYIKLCYADGGNLYVAVNQMDMVQKYIGASDVNPPNINSLNSVKWKKAKAKARKQIQILAIDLIEAYAKRQMEKGFRYSPDTPWQKEFEESFIYEETDDQLAAIEDVKADMESERIMDRLICGDVGFGKTEVAIRAAFKAVQDNKQVAFLVPTTILAQQHYQNFKERFERYPVNVELLSRFRSAKEQTKVKKGLKDGTVDIVIGTHKLLSKTIEYRDLGLVIIDEEQRFGVGQKEKIKAMKNNSDVLTLSATPIPRTLNMSMTGIRDMSLLTEAPGERTPVQTYVLEYSIDIIRDAIIREISRKGQVYFLHNRVSNIVETANEVQRAVPEARVAYAHGQMNETELENIMKQFMDNEIDVLVCTTIIETGLDIANVNTIIIQNADCMGLSQLYQLRGRVGRSNRTAFAYLCYKKDKSISEVSEKRLQTIREFTEFGSGFKIAMRDLEIRGAGNMLGAEQHGHIGTVGYDMYCKMLDEEIRKLKGEKVVEITDVQIDLSLNAYVPSSYIENEEQKIEMYKKISSIKNIEGYNDVWDELEDRFGNIPKPVKNLIDIALMKASAQLIGTKSIIQRGKKISITLNPENKADPQKLFDIIRNSRGKIKYMEKIIYNLDDGETGYIEKLKTLFESIVNKEVVE